MEHIAALLLIIGCSDDLGQCKELPAPVPVYETAEECESDVDSSVRTFTGTYPQVFVQCVAVDPALEEEDAELVWDIRKDGTLYAAVETPDVMVARTTERADRIVSAQE